MARGRKTGGRTAGTLNKATVERELRAAKGIEAAQLSGLLPLDVLLARMRDEPLPNGQTPTDNQVQAAIAAAPYIHAKLAATTLKGDPDAPLVHQMIDDTRPALDVFLLEFTTAQESDKAPPVTVERPQPPVHERASMPLPPRLQEPPSPRRAAPPPPSAISDVPPDRLAPFRGNGQSDGSYFSD